MKTAINQKFAHQNETKITNSPSKRIGYFAALLIVMGSSIGSGIFFKSGSVMENVQNSIILSLLSWVIAAFAIIAMAIALIDVAAASQKDDRGLLSWTKRFNSFYLYKSAKNGYSFIILPVKFFVLPVYFFQSLQSGLCYFDATWSDNGQIILSTFAKNVLDLPWWVIFLVVLGIDLWFIIVNGISIRIGNGVNKGLMYLKFIPLLFAFLIGFIVLGINKQIPNENHWWVDPNLSVNADAAPKLMVAYSPVIGMILSLAAIFYAYDGFYVVVGIQSQMKEPKKISSVLLFGLLLVTVVYLAIALSMTFGAPNGSWDNIAIFFVQHHVSWIYSVISILISIGIIGIVNNYSMWVSRFYSCVIESREIPFAKWLSKLRTKNHEWGGLVFLVSFGIIIAIVFILVGALGYDTSDQILVADKYPFSVQVNNLYQFTNLISNWQTLFSFMFITLAIFSSTKQKTQDKNYVKKGKNLITIIAGWLACFFIGLALISQLVEPFVNLGITVAWNNTHPEHHYDISSYLILIGVLVFICLVTFIPSCFEIRNHRIQAIYHLEAQIWSLKHELNLLEEKRDQLKVKSPH